jgi:hypothetical protein
MASKVILSSAESFGSLLIEFINLSTPSLIILVAPSRVLPIVCSTALSANASFSFTGSALRIASNSWLMTAFTESSAVCAFALIEKRKQDVNRIKKYFMLMQFKILRQMNCFIKQVNDLVPENKIKHYENYQHAAGGCFDDDSGAGSQLPVFKRSS